MDAVCALEVIAAIAATHKQEGAALTIIGCVDAWYRRQSCVRQPTCQRVYEIALESLDEQIL
jgi:hypothetical protein